MISYTANLSIGTPPQELSVRVDTGSSDLWVNTASSRVCASRRDPCSQSGIYEANSSSSYNFVSDDFSISYADGSGALGDYVTDTLNIGGVTLDDFQFGIGYASSSISGILGIGYPANEASVNRNNERPYPNLPQALVDANIIQSNAYSLWLDDLESSSGSLLFGGVDTNKYSGSLQTLPIQRDRGEYTQLIISISGMSITQGGQSVDLTSSLPVPAILDSGSSISYIPDQLAGDIFYALNVQYSQLSQVAYCSCALRESDISLNFTFTSPTISVPIRELVIDPEQDLAESIVLDKRQGPTYSYGNSPCLFGLAPSGGSLAILGDTFLRSAYVVYELANNEISLAQTNFNSTTTNIEQIGTGNDSVPDTSMVSDPVEAAVSFTGGARIATPSATGTAGSRNIESSGNSIASLAPMSFAIIACFSGMAFLLHGA